MSEGKEKHVQREKIFQGTKTWELVRDTSQEDTQERRALEMVPKHRMASAVCCGNIMVRSQEQERANKS